MKQTVVMPKMGDTMEEGKILRWIKHEGDAVKKGEALAEIETEKVNIEAEAFAAGVLRKIVAQEGETIAVGAPIALIGKADEPLPGAATSAAKPAASSRSSGANNGAKATPASATGTAVAEPPTAPATEAAGAEQTGERVFISPLARHIAAEHNLDVTRIAGTGPSGRILRDDVQAYLANPQAAIVAPPIPQAPQVSQAQPAPAIVQQTIAAAPVHWRLPARMCAPSRSARYARRLRGGYSRACRPRRTSMSRSPSRQTSSARCATRSTSTPRPPNPVKVSYNDLIVKAVAVALARMPQVNVSFDGEQLLFKSHINMGFAVAMEQWADRPGAP